MSDECIELISVVVNCHNSEKFIEECIYSILSQSYKNLEIIVWDNMSDDGTENIVKTLTLVEPRIKYYRGDSFVPLGSARNLALNKCGGKWIAFLDSDDIWHHNFLASQMNALRNKEETTFGFGFVTEFIDDFQSIGNQPVKNRDLQPEKNIFEKLLKGNFIYFSSLVFSREALVYLNKFEEAYVQAEDYELLLRLSIQYNAIQAGEVYYRLHENNLSKSQTKELYVENLDILKDYLDFRQAKVSFAFNFAKFALLCRKFKNYTFFIEIVRSRKYKISNLFFGLGILAIYRVYTFFLELKVKTNSLRRNSFRS
jgi:glycosyltransferase involved in cell wall biosynthesis